MISKKLLLICLALVGIHFTSTAQAPPNIDFETGTFAPWHTYTGTCCPGGVISATAETPAPVAGRHVIVSSGTDPYGLFPVVAPDGGSYSCKLGNSSTGAQAEKVRYYIHVPVGVADYSLVYRYAVVFQDPGHPTAQQPRFEVNAFDSASGLAVPCAQYSYVASSSLPGFLLAGTGSGVWYKPWTLATVNLSGLGGQTIIMDFGTGDCAAGAHFGYGYIDANVSLFQVATQTCDTSVPLSFTAPYGFESYAWYDSATFTIPYGFTQTITTPWPSGPMTYAVILTPFAGFGCPDTLYTHVVPANLVLHPSNDTTICSGRSVPLTSGATDIAYPLTYSWSPSTGLDCSTCATPTATPMVSTTYTVTVTNAANCSKWDTIRVNVFPDVTLSITSVDALCYGYNNGSATATPLTGTAPYSYSWNTSPPQTTATATTLTAGTYTVVVSDNHGCSATDVATINQPPPTVLSVVSSVNPTTCGGVDGSIKIGGLTPSTSFTIVYQFNGTPQTITLTSSSTGEVIISGLAQGIYSSITATGTICPYTTVGPVTLTDPPIPDLYGVGSNSFVCAGDPLTLTANSHATGVTYSWTGPAGFGSLAQNPAIDPASLANAGIYTVTIVVNNCYNHSTVTVDVRPKPVPSASNNSAICSGDTLYMKSQSANGATYYTWAGPNFYSSNSQNPYIANAQAIATGTYTVIVNLNGCSVPATTAAIVNQTPGAPAVHDTNYCQYDVPVPFYADGVNLLWYSTATGGTGTGIAPMPSTATSNTAVWYVTQTSPEGCVSQRSKVSARTWQYPAPFLTTTDSVSCAGRYITFTAGNTGEGYEGLTWIFEHADSIKNINPIYHSFGAPGTYVVSSRADYSYCPSASMTKQITIFSVPSVDLGKDTSICPGSAALEIGGTVSADGGRPSWLWNTGQTGNSITVATPGTYYATVTVNGCDATDSIYVGNDCYINIPNVFTPNGDGVNDYFFPRQYLTKGLTAFSMDIYNRWGQLMFRSTTLDGRGWDGKFNGTAQPEGVYVYSINAEFKDGQKEKHQGNVTLLK